jgi:hypothetical protein
MAGSGTILAQNAPTPDPNAPPVIRLEASASTIPAGTGVTVRAWVQHVKSASLDGEPVVNGYLEILARLCADHTFTLQSELLNGSTDTRTVTVAVTGECVPAPPITPGPTQVRPQRPPGQTYIPLNKLVPFRVPLPIVPTVPPLVAPYKFNPNDLKLNH